MSMVDGLFLAGCLLVTGGVAVLSWPAALVVAGVGLCVASWRLDN